MSLKGEGSTLPPLLEQYVALRDQYPDYLLLFQVGDFYETFGEDAERFARALNIILTHKTSRDFTTPMAGVPLRSADVTIEKLLNQGIRVAIADQTEVPQKNGAKGSSALVKREVTQLVTPGTVTEESLLKADANYVAAVATGDGYGVALLDVSTGEFRGTHVYSRGSLYDELERYHPAEVLLAPELAQAKGFAESFSQRFAVMMSSGRFDEPETTLKAQFETIPSALHSEALIRAAGAVLSYALETQQGKLPQVKHFIGYDSGAYMQIGERALATLEVFQAASNDPKHSLLGCLDETRTAPGKRLLKAWLRHPLLDEGLIAQRLNAVEAFVHDSVLRHDVRRALHKVHDLERLASRLASGRVSARDLAALSRSLSCIPELRVLLADHPTHTLKSLRERLNPLPTTQEHIDSALVDEPPQKLTEGGLIRDGCDRALDELRAQIEEGRAWIAALEASEREATEIPTLKIGFNGVFGYYLEVTRPYYEQVPESWRAVQTLKDRQRYTRADLREKERDILKAEEAAKAREYLVFNELRQHIAPKADNVRDLAIILAELDVLTSLAEVAARQHYCRPSFADNLKLEAARHPVVECHANFIANDLQMSENERLIILTGPNMSGKSTYLRQTALISLLAQIGSFVPAEAATVPLLGRIYTRIGAHDDIASGRSTFMVEMEELAEILQGTANHGTRMLVLLDEVGRGTSTYDGLSLAWAASDYLHQHPHVYTLFATHYFELTGLASDLPYAANYHVAAKEEAGALVFYHQVLAGAASKSYGVEVAKLAGVPNAVLNTAQQVLAGLEARHDALADEIVGDILRLEVSQLAPLEALNILSGLQKKARGETLSRA